MYCANEKTLSRFTEEAGYQLDSEGAFITESCLEQRILSNTPRQKTTETVSCLGEFCLFYDRDEAFSKALPHQEQPQSLRLSLTPQQALSHQEPSWRHVVWDSMRPSLEGLGIRVYCSNILQITVGFFSRAKARCLTEKVEEITTSTDKDL